jgi:superoxide reductase
MPEVGELYLCEICENKVQVVGAGFGELVCCGQPMTLVTE